MEIDFYENKIQILVQKSLYNSDVLYKCFYWYGADFEVEIRDASENEFLILLCHKEAIKDRQFLMEKIKRDLIDFKLRDIVTKETQVIRELLVAKAFANFEEEENNPSTDVSDPVGFNPLHLD